MRRAAPVIFVAVLALAATAAQAKQLWVLLEDRVATSDLIVVGQVTNVGDSFGLDDFPGTVRARIAVERVLKGDAEIKVVEMLYKKPPPRGRRTPKTILYAVGRQQVWMLERHEKLQDAYTDAYPFQIERSNRAGVVASVVAALSDPAKSLNDEPPGSRTRQSAAYFLLREAVPESRLPIRTVEADDSSGSGKKTVPDTTGYELLDKTLVNLSVTTAIDAFPSGKAELHALARAALKRVACPIATVEPPLPKIRATTAEQTKQFLKSHQKAWARAIRNWWFKNRKTLKLYVPKKPAVEASTPRLEKS